MLVICQMRNAWAYLMIVLYLLVVLRPSVPTICYYTQQDYFASELCRLREQPRNCCKGSCQIGRMAREATQTDPANPISRFFAEELPLLMLPSSAAVSSQLSRRQRFPQDAGSTLCTGIDHVIWHPPTIQA
jgi:hypothetical protein